MSHPHTNALAAETSPYLLQHAHNPVQWYPWGETALTLAKEKDMPILVSIGYSACHWCHVMERESFEDETVADYMNRHFINIKIDREERPDLDQVYMDAVQAITGSGGWPLHVFLTSEGLPYYGGTYFPPRRAFNRPSWMEVLQYMQDAWQNRQEEVQQQARQLVSHMEDADKHYSGQKTGGFQIPANETFLPAQARAMKEALMAQADTLYGGFGKAPKFPQTGSIRFLLAYHHFYGDDTAFTHARNSLNEMLRGGIYDQLGGGLSRYSTDDRWLVPHFEKMLYDNALLLMALSDACRLKSDSFLEEAIHDILHFLKTDMRNTGGGYYAALDADSEGEEGLYYIWTEDEFNAIAGADAALARIYYGVTERGNWEGKNILTRQPDSDALAEANALTDEELAIRLKTVKAKLLEARKKRVAPGLDDKIILGWNALLVSALAAAFAATGKEDYREEAISLFSFMRHSFADGRQLTAHTCKNGRATQPAFLDDYAFWIHASIRMQEITGDQSYLDSAMTYMETAGQFFSDSGELFYYYTHRDQADIITRKTDVMDNALPSGNSIMAFNLAYLGRVFGRKEWVERSRNMLQSLLPLILRHPGTFAEWASLFLSETVGFHEIVISGRDIDVIRKSALHTYTPNCVLVSSSRPETGPLFEGRSPGEKAMIYICHDFTCEKPVDSWESAKYLLKNHTELKE